jgi:CDP-diacylglycerol--serine O-phosphatidyltransferase
MVPKQMREISLRLMIPNIITILAFCSGLTSIRFALEGRWEGAVLSIVIAMILDGMDGRVARLLGATSRFGALLDSLSDLVCFGFAPAFLIYCFAVGKFIKFGWSGVMFYTACMALRLARFNALEEQNNAPSWLKHYFMGVPAPAGALLVVTPVCCYLATDMMIFTSFALNVGILWFVGLLLVSRIPTLCLKSIRIQQAWVPIYAVFFVLFVVLLYTHVWVGLGCISICYLTTIPYTYFKQKYI